MHFIYACVVCYFASLGFVGCEVWASVAAPDDQDFIHAVGFDMEDTVRNKLGLTSKASDAFMEAVYDLKQRLKLQGRTAQPLSLLLGAAMQTGNFFIFAVCGGLIQNKAQQEKLFRKPAHQKTGLDIALHDAFKRLYTLVDQENISNSKLKQLAPAYLEYTLNPSQEKYEWIQGITQNKDVLNVLFPLTLEGVQADLMQRIMAALPRDKDNKNENNEDNKKGYMAFFMAHPGARLAHLDAKVQEAAKLLAEDRPSALSALEHILTKGDAHPFFKGAKYEK